MQEIVIIGLGPGSLRHLSLEVWDILSKDKRIYLRTSNHPVVGELGERGLVFQSFDYLYQERNTFEEVYEGIVSALVAILSEDNTLDRVIYAVPGHPLVAERSVTLLIERCKSIGIDVKIITGMSFIDSLFTILRLDPSEGILFLDALDFRKEDLNSGIHNIFTQVYNRLVASDLKLQLLEVYPPHHQIRVVRGAGIQGQEEISDIPLWQLDHLDTLDHLTTIYLPPIGGRTQEKVTPFALDPLIDVMEKLLSPEGCPWDRKQNHFSLKPYLIEEAYEILEAIDSGEMNKIMEELGDLLLQIVFHTMLAQKRGDFTYSDVIDGITEKMIRRHPHVFGDVKVKDSAEVLKNWEQIKAIEKGMDVTVREKKYKVMASLNKSLPALLLAEEVQKKAKKVGFDWEDVEGPWEKVLEELRELQEAWPEDEKVEEEIGDLLFAVVNIARFAKISPEGALLRSTQKFIRRFNYIEDKLEQKKLDWQDMELNSLDSIWEEAKKEGL